MLVRSLFSVCPRLEIPRQKLGFMKQPRKKNYLMGYWLLKDIIATNAALRKNCLLYATTEVNLEIRSGELRVRRSSEAGTQTEYGNFTV